MAAGILAIGLMLVATMFPLGIHLSSVAAERTMAAVVADSAFAKIQLYGIDVVNGGWWSWPPKHEQMTYFEKISFVDSIDANEFAYPTTDSDPNTASQFYWSAACRKVNDDPCDTSVQVTVFVGRKKAPNQTFCYGNYDRPVFITLDTLSDNTTITIVIQAFAIFVNPPTTIADSRTGRLYRVIERNGLELTLDRPLDEDTVGGTKITVMPPPDSGGSRNADIDVFQRIIRF